MIRYAHTRPALFLARMEVGMQVGMRADNCRVAKQRPDDVVTSIDRDWGRAAKSWHALGFETGVRVRVCVWVVRARAFICASHASALYVGMRVGSCYAFVTRLPSVASLTGQGILMPAGVWWQCK